MHTFKAFFILEFKRFFGKRNGMLILMLFLLSLLFIQNGINEYKNILDHKEKFQEIEESKVSSYISYRVYGAYGFRMLFVPAPITIFFNKSGVISDMTSYVDSGERLIIYNSLKGKNVFNLKKWGLTDFSGIILFFASLLALFYGYETLSNAEYFKFLSTLASPGKVFFSLLVSRIILMLLLFMFITAGCLLLFMLNNLHVPLDKYILYFLLLVFLISIFFFVMGTAFSTIKSKIIGLSSLLSIWFILLFIVPTVINSYIANQADVITPIYRMEMDKFKILSDFENRYIENEGPFTPGKKVTPSMQNRVLSFMKNEFVKLQDLEEDMRNQMERKISLFQGLSTIFPSSFYVSVNNEISSRGYENLIEFYKYVLKLKWKFVEFYLDKVYYTNFSKVESFIKDDENVFHSQSRLPGFFIIGILVTVFYIAGLFWVSYIRYKGALNSIHENADAPSMPADLELKKGQFKVLVSEGDLFKNQLFNRYSRSEEGREGKFLYLCHPENIPGDIKSGDFLFFIKRLVQTRGKEPVELRLSATIKAISWKKFSRLKNHEKGEIILAVLEMKRKEIYLVYDAARGMPIEFTVQLKEKMQQLKEEGAMVIYLTPDELINVQSIKKRHGLHESTTWCELVDHYKGLLDIQ